MGLDIGARDALYALKRELRNNIMRLSQSIGFNFLPLLQDLGLPP